jgi:rhodanese-related sulfurtransferase
MASLKTIPPNEAAALVRKGAVLIDVREAHEHAAEHIPGARHHALSKIDPRHPIEAGDTVLVFHCKSGGRTNLNAARLAAAAGTCEAYVLGGGIDAWRRAGLPTSAAAKGEKTAGKSEGGLIGRISSLFR